MAKLLARYQRQQLTDPEQHIEAPYPGYLGGQDTYFVGTLKGVGRVYAQTFVEAHGSWAAAKLYLSKIPMTAVDLLHERVLPVYDQAGIPLERVLTDNGREYCGRALQHPYELYLTVQQIEHRNTKVHSPQTNGFCERFHRTLKDEFLSVAYRKKLYGSVQELQEAWMPSSGSTTTSGAPGLSHTGPHALAGLCRRPQLNAGRAGAGSVGEIRNRRPPDLSGDLPLSTH